MTTAKRPAVWTDSHEFVSPLRAIIWKEWRESRRQFIGCVVLLFVLPVAMGILHDLVTGDEKSAMMALTALGSLVSVPLAAGWGAYSVCRDLTASRAAFLLAQPLAHRSVLFSKALVALTLFSLLALAYSTSVIVFTDFVAEAGVNGIATMYLYICALLLVLALSFLAAVCLRRLVPSILFGLVSALVFIAAPISLSEYFFVRAPETTDTVIFAAVYLSASVLFLCAACVWGWPAHRLAISNRTLGWSIVCLVLFATAMVSSSLATDTDVITEFGDVGAVVLGSEGNSAYWVGRAPTGRNGTPTINRTRFDSEGHVVETHTIRLLGFERLGDLSTSNYSNYLSDDFQQLLVVRSTSDYRTKSILKYDLNFELPEAHGELAFQFNRVDLNGIPFGVRDDFPMTDWRFMEGALYGFPKMSYKSVCVGAFDTSDPKIRLRSLTPPLNAERAQFHVKDGEISVYSYCDAESLYALGGDNKHHGIKDRYMLQRLLVNRADPDSISFSQTSDPLLLRGMNQNYGFFAMDFIAIRGDRVAISTDQGIGLYECDAQGRWTELGWRRAGLLEILSGRRQATLSWRDDRLAELILSRIIVYDTSEPRRPRRIAHVAGAVSGKVGWIDSRHFVVRGLMRLEVHRLPD